MKSVDKILSNFTKTVNKLDKVADKNTAKAERIHVRRAVLAQRETTHLNEATKAKIVSQRLNSLFSGE